MSCTDLATKMVTLIPGRETYSAEQWARAFFYTYCRRSMRCAEQNIVRSRSYLLIWLLDQIVSDDADRPSGHYGLSSTGRWTEWAHELNCGARHSGILSMHQKQLGWAFARNWVSHEFTAKHGKPDDPRYPYSDLWSEGRKTSVVFVPYAFQAWTQLLTNRARDRTHCVDRSKHTSPGGGHKSCQDLHRSQVGGRHPDEYFVETNAAVHQNWRLRLLPTISRLPKSEGSEVSHTTATHSEYIGVYNLDDVELWPSYTAFY